jgi:transposase-like protein
MGRKIFSREFKLEAVKLVRDRGVAVAQACRDLDVAESMLRRWMRETEADPRYAFPSRQHAGHALALAAARRVNPRRRPANPRPTANVAALSSPPITRMR